MREVDDQSFLDSPRVAHQGRTFVYVLPCLDEDLTKVGFTHDPVQRFRSFHPRFFALFDLERGMLVDTGRLRDARRLERLLIERWPEHRASAPLLVSEAAGGHTEWFRGIGGDVDGFVRRTAERYGYTLHAPLRGWLHRHFSERADQLYEWSSRMLDMIAWQEANLPPESRDPRYVASMKNTLDACQAVGMDLARWLPPRAIAWYTGISGEGATQLVR